VLGRHLSILLGWAPYLRVALLPTASVPEVQLQLLVIYNLALGELEVILVEESVLRAVLVRSFDDGTHAHCTVTAELDHRFVVHLGQEDFLVVLQLRLFILVFVLVLVVARCFEHQLYITFLITFQFPCHFVLTNGMLGQRRLYMVVKLLVIIDDVVLDLHQDLPCLEILAVVVEDGQLVSGFKLAVVVFVFLLDSSYVGIAGGASSVCYILNAYF
jgi:hypothetical protein